MSDEQFPSNRKNWLDTELEAGESSNSDKGELVVPFKVSDTEAEGLPFGVFAVDDGNTSKLPRTGDTKVIGISTIVQNSSDFENRNSLINTQSGIARRGFFAVKIDAANAPSVGGGINIIKAAGALNGALTSLTTGIALVVDPDDGMRIEEVFTNVALVYLPGKAVHTVTEPV